MNLRKTLAAAFVIVWVGLMISEYAIALAQANRPEAVVAASPPPAAEGAPGTGASAPAPSSAKVLAMVATAYNGGAADNGRWVGQPTASGRPLEPGVVAVDPDVIPLGTHLYVEGYGYAVAADTGSAIKGNRIDLYMAAPANQVSAFGIKKLSVFVLD